MNIIALQIDTKLDYEDVIETIIETYSENISMLGYSTIFLENNKTIVSTEIYSENIEVAKKNELFIKEKLNELNIEYNISFKELEEDSYLYAYREFLKPIQIGEITIIPGIKSDYPDIDSKNKNNIFIAKQYAFGTGMHETTMLAMEMLYEYSKNNDIRECSVVDVGCGSGILSLMARVLGAYNVAAIDNDLQAVNCSCDNMKYNGVTFDMLIEGDAAYLVDKKQKYDIVIANIETDILISIIKDLVKLAKKGGTIILSGILKTKFDDIRPKIENYKYSVKERNDWMSLIIN